MASDSHVGVESRVRCGAIATCAASPRGSLLSTAQQLARAAVVVLGKQWGPGKNNTDTGRWNGEGDLPTCARASRTICTSSHPDFGHGGQFEPLLPS